jgi:hypothetical protein
VECGVEWRWSGTLGCSSDREATARNQMGGGADPRARAAPDERFRSEACTRSAGHGTLFAHPLRDSIIHHAAGGTLRELGLVARAAPAHRFHQRSGRRWVANLPNQGSRLATFSRAYITPRRVAQASTGQHRPAQASTGQHRPAQDPVPAPPGRTRSPSTGRLVLSAHPVCHTNASGWTVS